MVKTVTKVVTYDKNGCYETLYLINGHVQKGSMIKHILSEITEWRLEHTALNRVVEISTCEMDEGIYG